MHDALLGLGFVTPAEAARNDGWPAHLDALARDARATRVSIKPASLAPGASPTTGCEIWVAAERLPQLQALFEHVELAPPIAAPDEFARRAWTREAALTEIVRSRLEGLGPVTSESIAASICVPVDEIDAALATLATQGVAIAGAFTPSGPPNEWCDRALLARIHRYTVQRLRQEIEPVSTQDFMRFLFRWQHLRSERAPGRTRRARRGDQPAAGFRSARRGVGVGAAARASRRLRHDMARRLCLSGRAVWTRLTLPAGASTAGTQDPSARHP